VKILSCAFWAAAFCLLVSGCAHLTDEQKARVNVLVQENETLARKMATLLEKAKAGEITPTEIVLAIEEVRATMEKNKSEIADIQASGATWSAIIGGVAGTIGRSALHAVALAVPAAGPWGIAIQGLLTMLLGGSATKKAEAKT